MSITNQVELKCQITLHNMRMHAHGSRIVTRTKMNRLFKNKLIFHVIDSYDHTIELESITTNVSHSSLNLRYNHVHVYAP